MRLKKYHIRNKRHLRRERNEKFSCSICFSICVPLYNTPEKYLKELICSVQSQSYENWELILADGSNIDDVGEYCQIVMKNDNRVHYIKLDENMGISGNTNEAIKVAKGDYIGFLDHDDILHPSLLFELAKTIELEKADFIYTDEAVITETVSDIAYLKLKPDFSKYELRVHNYICHFVCCSRELLDAVGYFNGEFDGSQDHDMALRLSEKAKKIVHIPQILYYWRMHENSVAYSVDVKEYAVNAAINSVKNNLGRLEEAAKVDSAHPYRTLYRVEYFIRSFPQITVVIHSAVNERQTAHCIATLYNSLSYLNFRIVNASHEEFRNEIWDGDYILYLHGSLLEASPRFMSEMLMFAQRNDVGAVGAKALYRDGRIHNAGISLFSQAKSGVRYWYHGEQSDQQGYEALLKHPRGITAVWDGCLLVRTNLLRKVGGFRDSPSLYEGVDLCLKLRQLGFYIIWTPYAEMRFDIPKYMNAQGRSVPSTNVFRRKWKELLNVRDPYYHPYFSKLNIF